MQIQWKQLFSVHDHSHSRSAFAWTLSSGQTQNLSVKKSRYNTKISRLQSFPTSFTCTEAFTTILQASRWEQNRIRQDYAQLATRRESLSFIFSSSRRKLPRLPTNRVGSKLVYKKITTSYALKTKKQNETMKQMFTREPLRCLQC